MSRRRALARLVDPWAALLLGVLVALGVVILLATPGPWHEVVGPAPVKLVEPPPRDIALFVRAARPDDGCTSVAWLHVDYDEPSLAVVLVPTETEVPVQGGGLAPVGRLAIDAGPAAATAGLAEALQTPLGGYIAVGRNELRLVLAAARSPGAERLGMPAFRQAVAALQTEPVTLEALTAQQRTLARVVPAIPFTQLNQAAIVNYILGSTEVDTDLDLRVASRVVRTLRSLEARTVAVRTLPVIVERCGPAARWRADRARAERLRLSLAYGLAPPRTRPTLTVRARVPEVVVLAPAGAAARRFARLLDEVLGREAAGPVGVRLAPLPRSAAGEAELRNTIVRRRPLGVLVAPSLGEQDYSASPSPPADGDDLLAGLLAGLTRDTLPTVVLVASADVIPQSDPGAGPIAPAPVVVAPVGGVGGQAPAGVRDQARLAAYALQRSCWPGYLAPELRGTRSGFSYAARRAFTLALIGGDSGEPSLAARLVAAGYTVRPIAADAWTPPAPGSLIACLPGQQRAARALQGDLDALRPPGPRGPASLPVYTVEDAPEPVVLVLDE